MPDPKPTQDLNNDEYAQIEAAEKVNDPGEAHRKGYTADPPGAGPSGPPPIPLKPETEDAKPKRR